MRDWPLYVDRQSERLPLVVTQEDAEKMQRVSWRWGFLVGALSVWAGVAIGLISRIVALP